MTLAARVVSRYTTRIAGGLHVPPAMYHSIMEWVTAVLAANRIQEAQATLDRNQDLRKTRRVEIEKLRALAKNFQNDLTWKNYTALYDASWLFGHPGSRWTVRDFQKMTPEKKIELQRRADALLTHIEEQTKYSIEADLAREDNELIAIREAKSYARPGVEPLLKGSIEKSFPIELQGWRYDNAAISKQIEEKFRQEKATAQDAFDRVTKKLTETTTDADRKQLLELLEHFRFMAEKGYGFDHINVVLTLEPSDVFNASWHPAFRTLRLIVPTHASPWAVKRLGQSLQHELRHFAQSYIAYAVNQTFSKEPSAGRPSTKIQTPQFKQEYDPRHPSYLSRIPDEFTKIHTKLKEKGIDPSKVDWHSLDDVEFYTRLADSIEAFQNQWQEHGKPELLNHAVRLWVGATKIPKNNIFDRGDQTKKSIEAIGGYEVVRNFKTDPFFLALRKMAAGKWRKAVSEFVAVVT